MKPARFAYAVATSVEHAVALLASVRGEGKVIAGGQSLMPMMNFRLVKPELLVDINRIVGLDTIEDLGAKLRIGALVRHRMTAADPLIASRLPVLHEAMQHVAHLTVRNRGTLCGSLCHADPAAEIPMLALLLDGEVHITGPDGARIAPARDFLVASLTTDLAADELVTAIDLAIPAPGTGWGFAEFARRHGDFALAAAAALVERRGGLAGNVRLAAMGVGDTALRLPAIEQALEGRELNDKTLTMALAGLSSMLAPPSDLAASSDYRLHLVRELIGKVLVEAWNRASEAEA